MSPDSRSGGRGGLDVVPLSQRVAAMMALRVTLCLVLAAVAVGSQAAPLRPVVAVAAGYLLVSVLLSGLALLRVRSWAVRAFGTSLLLDGALLQVQHEVVGHAAASDTAIAIYLTAVCLLGSFRSGLKIGVWQSLLMIAAVRAEQSGVLPMPGWAHGVQLPGRTLPGRDVILAADIALVWLTVLTASAAASINERELRRRRYDAEALHRFATDAQTDVTPEQVAARLCAFVTDELLATRALVCRNTEQGWSVVTAIGPGSGAGAGAGAAAAPGAAVAGLPQQATPSPSALLNQPTGPEREVLSLRLDPTQDPWLAARLPGARRLISLSLDDSDAGHESGSGAGGRRERWWLVFEHGARRGSRVERRVVSTAAQATATATLALSRARLLEQAERAASTDGLTGVANRRIFDQLLADLVGRFVATGAPFALVMTDVDKFKSINDGYGHQTGDQVLQAVARNLTVHSAPGPDRTLAATPARYGGEEFAVLIPGATVEQAVDLAETFRIGLRSCGSPVPVTASFGVAVFPSDARDAEELVWKADAALMHAKQTGRDRVVRADRIDPAAVVDSSSPGR